MIVYTQGRAREKYEYFSKGDGVLETTNIAVLINEGSASASEIFIGTVKDYFLKSTIIWEKSYWKGSVQTIKLILMVLL